MVDANSLFDDITHKLSLLRQELEGLRRSEQQWKQTEKSLAGRNRIHSLLNSVRAQLLKHRTREELFDTVCATFVESGVFHAAWIGTIDPDSSSVYPETSAIIDEERFGVRVKRFTEDLVIRGIIADTVASDSVFVSNDIAADSRLEAFHPSADRRHDRSMAAFPISGNGSVVGALLLFSAYVDFFSDEVVNSIHQVCRELSLGLERMIDRQDIRREIDSLKETISNYQLIADRHFIGIAVIQQGIIKYANEAIAEMFGYSVDEMLRWKPDEFTKIIHPDDVEDVTGPDRRKAREINGVTYYSYRIVTGRNETKRIHRYSKTIFYGGELAHCIAILDDEMMPPGVISEPEKPAVIRGEENSTRIFFDTNPHPLLVIDFDTYTILQANNAAVEQYGYSEVEFREMKIRTLCSEDEITRFIDHLTRLPLLIQMEITTKHRKQDGTVFDVEVAARYIRLADKTVALMAVRDITNKKWAEDVLRESEANYRNIFNTIGYMLFVIDRDARILDINNFATEALQKPREDVIGQDVNCINAVEKNTLDDFRRHLERAFENGKHRFKWYLKSNDNRLHPVELILQQGEYFGHEVVIALAREVTPNRGTAPNELHTTLEVAPAAIAITDNDGKFTWVNRAFARLLETTAAELSGKDIASLRTEGRSEEAFKRLRQAMSGAKVWSGEVFVKTGTGRATEIDLIVNPVISNADTPVGFVLTARNLGEEKERIQQLLQKQKMESIDTISRAIAHDFNNILGIILGYASFLEKRKEDPEKFHTDIAEIKNAVQRGANLIKQMLAYTHREDVPYESISVNEVVQDVIGMLHENFPDSIEIAVELNEKTPDVSVSRHQLQQILNELCINSRDAIEDPNAAQPGKGRIVIETRPYEGKKLRNIFPAAAEDAYVEIRVTDTGVGMDEDTKTKVFDPFFSAKEYGKGKGLGLTQVYGIVKSYDGFIRIESEPKRGTVFMIYLPANDGSAKETEIETEPGETSTDISPPAGNTILVVEDEPSLLQLLQHVLEDNGYRVLTASDGIEGVKMYETNQRDISLVVSDVGLPKLDGFNAFLQMRRINPNVNAVLASGHLDDRVKVDLYKEGVRGFIKKPYQPEEILSKINELLTNNN